MQKIIKLLIYSDIFLITGFGLIAPIFAIFIKENLIGGSLVSAGLASSLYLVVKSVVELPSAKYVDKHRHRVLFLILGTFLISIVPFLYVFSTHVKHIYIAQVLYGFGAALSTPTFLALFSKHLDKKKEDFEWAVYGSVMGLGTAATAYLGATAVTFFNKINTKAIIGFDGFQIVFLIVGLMSLTGMFILFFLDKKSEKQRLRELGRVIIPRGIRKSFIVNRKGKIIGKHISDGHHYH